MTPLVKNPDTLVYEYARAKKTADRVIELLTPHCEADHIHIAGSILREKEFVKDIEVVCLPKKIFHPDDLFGGGKYAVSAGFVQALDHMKEKTIKGTYLGRYMKMILKGGKPLDLFMPTEEDYFRILAIRTGSENYSKQVLAKAWTDLGWCGTDLGLRRRTDCSAHRNHDGKIVSWSCINKNGEVPPVWKSEKEFFEWLGVKWIEPKYR